jgi:ABC-type nitrate/sulfonate/bicarbonate transport system substrate-binding protein
MARNRLITEQPDAAAGAMRAVVKAQQALMANPALASPLGRRLFPPPEAELIAELIERDAPFYAPQMPEDKVLRMTQFAQGIGLFRGPVPFERVVATQLAYL